MKLFNFKNIIQLISMGIIYFVFASVVILGTEATGPLIQVTASLVLSSCTTAEPHPQLPNLTFVKKSEAWEDYYSCNQTGYASGGNVYMSFYSYISPPPTDCCINSTCHTIDVSKLPLTSQVWEYIGSNFVVAISGTISAGPYTGLPYVWTIVHPIADELACTKPAGQQIASGSTTLAITGGPTCTGVHTIEYCPGLRSQ